MQPPISKDTKSAIIVDWLRGRYRDEIANRHLISGGSVSNIIRDWRAELDDGVADGMRELALALRKLRLTAPECALGTMVASTMKSMGVHENDFFSYLAEICKPVKKSGYDPRQMVQYLAQIRALSELTQIPIEQLPRYISEQISERDQLSKEIEKLKVIEIEEQSKADTLKRVAGKLQKELQHFDDFKKGLQKYGVEIDNLPSFTKTLKEAHDLGYDSNIIISQLSEFDVLLRNQGDLRESVAQLQVEKDNLEARNKTLLESLSRLHVENNYWEAKNRPFRNQEFNPTY